MNHQIEELLERVRAEYAAMDVALPAPAEEGDLAAAEGWVAEHHPALTLPPQLVAFWRRHNGLEIDGKVIYAALDTGNGLDDLAGVNALYVDDQPDHVLVGQADDVYFFAWRPSSGAWEYVGMGDFDGQVDERFGSFDELVAHALGEALG